jgi:serine/threonine protein kinase
MTSATDLLGHKLGGYELSEIVGSGAMATVFKAFQPELERWVAVKVLHYRERSAVVRFRREARAIALLRHRNILIVYEYGEANKWPFIVMEYVPGGTLSDILSDQPLPWSQAVRLVIPVAQALYYAHSQDIIHRDVKPSNILLAQPDWPLLADFGLAKLPETEQSVTQTGASLGTPAYVSPEQARGEEIDNRTDIYALGVVLFEMITGRLPFNYSNPNRVLLAHISEPAPRPRSLNAACPAELEQIIITLMQKLPGDRYRDLGQLIEVLEKLGPDESQSAGIASESAPDSRQGLARWRRGGSQQTKELEPIPESLIAKPARPDPSAQPLPSRAETGSDFEARIFLTDKKASLRIPNQETVIIGRTYQDIKADVDLGPYGGAELGVSRHHARLTIQGRQWLIDDLGSLNGTFVNEVQVVPGKPVSLKNGDLIRCSHLSFIFLLSTGTA